MLFDSSAISVTIRIDAPLHSFLGAMRLTIPSYCVMAAFERHSVKSLQGEGPTLRFSTSLELVLKPSVHQEYGS
jgi:hypothetical protein